MRVAKSNGAISVRAISGDGVVLLGMNATREARRGLIGFAIERRHDGARRPTWLRGNRHFPGERGGRPPDSRKAPIQSFLWGDYTAAPGRRYRYTVHPVYGEPGALRRGESVGVSVSTEKPGAGHHGIHFNRGVAGSQAYSRRFGAHRRFYKVEQYGRERWREFVKPADVPDRSAWQWLSRGLEEALFRFLAQARGPQHSLRAAVYEFDYVPVIQAFVDALERGADVRIVYHARRRREVRLRSQAGGSVLVSHPEEGESRFRGRILEEVEVPDATARATLEALAKVGVREWPSTRKVDAMMTGRTRTTIAHNKFVVLLEDHEPVQVWTGSTNLTAGGLFGQSNVGHVIRDPEVAARFLEYWELLATDPSRAEARRWTVETQPDLVGAPPRGMTPIFSPRSSTAMLDWYAERIGAAKESVHFTAAFGVSQQLASKLVDDEPGRRAPLRYVMLESRRGRARSERSKKAARRRGDPEPIDFYDLAESPNNWLAWGATRMPRRSAEPGRLLDELLTGLNDHVEYLHTKYLLVDPLGDDPLVITGSANFSEASTTNNDENMLVVRGDPQIADLFLCDFMRLFSHFRRRNALNDMGPEEAERAELLAPDDSWIRPYFERGHPLNRERLLFGVPV